MYALMNQAITPFTVVFSLLLLGTRYTAMESLSVCTVAVAAVFCVLVAHADSGEDNVFWGIFAALTTSFAALAMVLKELAFRCFLEEEKSPIVHNLPNQGLGQPLVEAATGNVASGMEGIASVDLEVAVSGAHEPDRLNIFLMGVVLNTVNLIVCVPVALLNQVATSSEPAVPALVA
eukprot:1760633-Amphidinium_carterae.1